MVVFGAELNPITLRMRMMGSGSSVVSKFSMSLANDMLEHVDAVDAHDS
jgi:hypothetical protein